MEIRFYKPGNPRLQKYIEGFHFLTCEPGEKPFGYIAFPGVC